jgi:hypothetical protein
MSETPSVRAISPAASIPWAQTVKEDGTFKDAEDLATLYEAKGIVDGDIIAHCRIGERSAIRGCPSRAARLQPGSQLRRVVDRVRSLIGVRSKPAPVTAGWTLLGWPLLRGRSASTVARDLSSRSWAARAR